MGQRIGRIQWGPLTFGPGTPYGVSQIEGIDDLPDISAPDVDREDQHGEFTGPDYTKARTVQLGLSLHAEDPDSLRDLTLALRAATQPQTAPAPLQLLDWNTLVYGKVRRRSLPYDAEYIWRTGTAALEFYCADPFLYSLEERTASTTAYSPSTGRTYPMTHPRVYGSAGASGRITATNAGSAGAYPVFRVDGPVANPQIEQVNTGAILIIDATLQPGEYLTIDTRNRAVLLQGTAPRRQWIRAGSTWPILQPGPNEIAYRGAALPGAPDQTSLLTVTWRDASL